jgi:hypothetical protein
MVRRSVNSSEACQEQALVAGGARCNVLQGLSGLIGCQSFCKAIRRWLSYLVASTSSALDTRNRVHTWSVLSEDGEPDGKEKQRMPA